MKTIEARVTFVVSSGALAQQEDIGVITSHHETSEQALAWCRYLARLGILIADRDVRGTLLAVEEDKGR